MTLPVFPMPNRHSRILIPYHKYASLRQKPVRAQLKSSWGAFIRSAVMAGKPGWPAVRRSGAYSRYEIAYRAAICYANLRNRINHTLERSPITGNLDPTEIGVTSYYIGNAVTMLLSTAIVGVKILQHVDRFPHKLVPEIKKGERPDYIGLDPSGQWHVIESKGRSNPPTVKLRKKAKRQAGRIKRVNGATVASASACISFFASGQLNAEFIDPPPNGSDCEFDMSEYLAKYYEDVLSAVDIGIDVIVGDVGMRVVRLSEMDMWLGLTHPVLQALTPGDPTPTALSSSILNRAGSGELGFNLGAGAEDQIVDASLGQDGVFVALGRRWSEDMMRLLPGQRYRAVLE